MIKAKEKPIIFSTGLIPAIQNLKPGTWPPEPIDPGKPWKWQTRRTGGLEEVNNNNMTWELKNTGTLDYMVKKQYKGRFGAYFHSEQIGDKTLYVCPQVCPYPPGMILYVRETWQDLSNDKGEYVYLADGDKGLFNKDWGVITTKDIKWCPSIHMPRAAARLFLEVKSARPERVQDITEEDARAEGILPDTPFKDMGYQWTARDNFIELWDTLYAKRGYPWENNDWVWVYEFMRTEARP